MCHAQKYKVFRIKNGNGKCPRISRYTKVNLYTSAQPLIQAVYIYIRKWNNAVALDQMTKVNSPKDKQES